MWRIIFLFLIPFSVLIHSQNDQQKKPWITRYEFEIPANLLTKIVMYNSDSTTSFTLFENIIEIKQKVVFITQPAYFFEKNNYKDDIVIPYPKTESGLYSIHYLNKDTSFVKKMVFLK